MDDYNNRSRDEALAAGVLIEASDQLTSLFEKLKTEMKSFLGLGISCKEKAFYDIFKAVAKKEFEHRKRKLNHFVWYRNR